MKTRRYRFIQWDLGFQWNIGVLPQLARKWWDSTICRSVPCSSIKSTMINIPYRYPVGLIIIIPLSYSISFSTKTQLPLTSNSLWLSFIVCIKPYVWTQSIPCVCLKPYHLPFTDVPNDGRKTTFTKTKSSRPRTPRDFHLNIAKYSHYIWKCRWRLTNGNAKTVKDNERFSELQAFAASFSFLFFLLSILGLHCA